MTLRVRLLSIFVSLGSVAHVGAGFAQSPQSASAAPPPARGQLLQNPPPLVGSYTVSQLLSMASDGTISQWLLKQIVSPDCSVDIYQFQFGTIGAVGEPTTDSGALMVPSGPNAACQGPRPIVLYAHGLKDQQNFNIADLSGNTADDNFESIMLAIAFAASGYIVVAPNYAGYYTSSLAYHPFMNGEQNAVDMYDALTAARTALPALEVSDNQKLFITGYSEGGYVAMATHRAFQEVGVPVTASAPMSGPYALSAFADAMVMGEVGLGAVNEFAMLTSSYQHAYGNLYSSPTDLFEPQYAAADTLLPTKIGVDQLVAQGQLPANALFSNMPPSPAFAADTPAMSPGSIAIVFGAGFGPNYLITNSYRLNYLMDALVAPDGGFPLYTSGLPPASATNMLRQDLAKNDLRNWSPTAPVFLCGGDQDPEVFWLNAQLMMQYWATHAPGSPVSALDLESSGGPYKSLRDEFALTKTIMRWIDGRAAVRDDYHGFIVPAFCVQAVRSFFDSF